MSWGLGLEELLVGFYMLLLFGLGGFYLFWIEDFNYVFVFGLVRMCRGGFSVG